MTVCKCVWCKLSMKLLSTLMKLSWCCLSFTLSPAWSSHHLLLIIQSTQTLTQPPKTPPARSVFLLVSSGTKKKKKKKSLLVHQELCLPSHHPPRPTLSHPCTGPAMFCNPLTERSKLFKLILVSLLRCRFWFFFLDPYCSNISISILGVGYMNLCLVSHIGWVVVCMTHSYVYSLTTWTSRY